MFARFLVEMNKRSVRLEIDDGVVNFDPCVKVTTLMTFATATASADASNPAIVFGVISGWGWRKGSLRVGVRVELRVVARVELRVVARVEFRVDARVGFRVRL